MNNETLNALRAKHRKIAWGLWLGTMVLSGGSTALLLIPLWMYCHDQRERD